MTEEQDYTRLIDLILRSDLVSQENLSDCLKYSEKMHLPLSRILEMNGYLSFAGMQAALQLLELLDRNTITLEAAVKTLSLVAKQGVDVETALRKLSPGVQKDRGKLTNKLGELMRSAGLVTAKQLEFGVSNSLNTGLPLGMVLLGTGAISAPLLHSALTALRMVRDGVVSREQAVQALRIARLKMLPFKQALQAQNFDIKNIESQFGLGELFAMARFMTEGQLLSVQELELVMDKTIEDVLIECGCTNQMGINAANHLLQMIKAGTLFEDQAAEILNRLKGSPTQAELDEVLSSIGNTQLQEKERVDGLDLVDRAGLAPAAEVAAITKTAIEAQAPVAKALVDSGLLDKQTIENINSCKSTIEAGFINIEQGIIALVYAKENNVNFTETLTRFGWTLSVKAE